MRRQDARGAEVAEKCSVVLTRRPVRLVFLGASMRGTLDKADLTRNGGLKCEELSRKRVQE